MVAEINTYPHHWSRTAAKERFIKQAEQILREKGIAKVGGRPTQEIILDILTDEIEPGQPIRMDRLRSDLTMTRALKLVREYEDEDTPVAEPIREDLSIRKSVIISMSAGVCERGAVVYLNRGYAKPITLYTDNKYPYTPLEQEGLAIFFKVATWNGKELTDEPGQMDLGICYRHRAPDDDYEIVSLDTERKNGFAMKTSTPPLPADESAEDKIARLRKLAGKRLKQAYPDASSDALQMEFGAILGKDATRWINDGADVELALDWIDKHIEKYPEMVTAEPEPIAPEMPLEAPTIDEPAETVTATIEPIQRVAVPAVANQSAIVAYEPNAAIINVKTRLDTMRAMRRDKVLIEGTDYGMVPGTTKNTLFKPGAEKLCSVFNLYPRFIERTMIQEFNQDKPLFFYRYECELIEVGTDRVIGTGIGSCNSMESKYGFRWVSEAEVPTHLEKSKLKTRDGMLTEMEFGIQKGETTGKWGKPEGYWKTFREAIANGTAVKGISKPDKNGKVHTTWTIGGIQYALPNEDIFSLVNTIDKMAQKRALIAATLVATNASEEFTQDVEDLPGFGFIDAEIVTDNAA